jgi:uncharacterized protein YjbI with pentapeptide repeats
MNNFSEQLYESTTFKDIELIAGELVGIEFVECVFRQCVFTETVFRNCRFRNCEFDTCDLSLVNVSDSAFIDTRFENSKLIGVDWTRASWGIEVFQLLRTIHFYGCVINYSGFIGLKLEKIQIEKCTAWEVDFSDANLKQANFKGTDLEKAIFRNSDLTGANFVGALNYFIPPQINKLKGAKFSLPEAMSLLYGLEIVLEEEIE